ncbi:MAG: polysaccharide biosynthesis tyrosine autokinase [Deltaproteobacteria bacterium]|nr:polysaccharide biosynthesis tyrosine autokinase [Deltaproteobacteria bacterium]
MKLDTDEIHLLDYWRVLLKRRHIAISVLVAAVGLTAIYSFLLTPVYQGTARILIDLERNGTMNFSEDGAAVIQMRDTSDYFKTQTEILASRSFADRVVRKAKLDKNPYYLEKLARRNNSIVNSVAGAVKDAIGSVFPPKVTQIEGFADLQSEQELDPGLTDIVLDEVSVETGRDGNIMTLQYQSESPVVAAAMANAAAEAYIEHNLEIRVRPYRSAVEWLSARLVEIRAKVESSEKALQQYKEGKGIVSFESKENVITQKLGELVTQMVVVQGKRAEAEVRYNQIKSVINSPELLYTVPDIMNNLVIQGLRNEELGLKKKISEMSETYGQKHPQMIKAKNELDSVQKNIRDEARKMLNAAKIEYEISRNRETSLEKEVEDQKREVLTLSQKAIDFNVLAGESESNKQFYEILLKKLQEASLSSGINISGAQVIDPAVVPQSPVRPRKAFNLLLALFAGAFGGVLAAMFVEYMDDTIKGPEDVDRLFQTPCLGVVPSSNEGEGPLYVKADAKSSIVEAYRGIRTGILLSSVDNALKVILVTSTTPSEGKTTTAANLAVSMALMGEKVLLIDLDMRRHNVHEVFGLDNTVGISDMIINHGILPGAEKDAPGIPNLKVITGGTVAPNPAEILASAHLASIVSGLRGRYDRIIIDSPPLVIFSDSLILSRIVDGTILVVWAGVTGKGLVDKCIQSLVNVNAKMLGVVINKFAVSGKRGSGYSSYSYYHYYDTYYNRKSEKKASFFSGWFGR